MKQFKKPINNFSLIEKQNFNCVTVDPFILKIYNILDEKIDDPELNIANLANYLNISRVQLHRKIKLRLGIAASNMVRNYRLKKAIEYLESGKTSSETAFLTGFDSPSYFSKCFKSLYGKSPIEYQKTKNLSTRK